MQITQPRHQQLLQREFGIRASVVAPHLEPTIQPVVVVASPQVDEWSASSDVHRFVVGFNATANASSTLFFQIVTVAGVVLIVRSIRVTAASAAFPVNLGPITSLAGAGVPTSGTYLNRRLSDVGPASACQLSQFTTTASAPGLIASYGVFDMGTGVAPIELLPYPFITQPGYAGLQFGFAAGTSGNLKGAIVWDEVALTGER